MFIFIVFLGMAMSVIGPSAHGKTAEDSGLIKKIRSIKGYRTRKLLRSFHTTTADNKKAMDSYYKSLKGPVRVLVSAPIRFQTGPYKRLSLSDQLFRNKCLKQIIWSATQLNKVFPKISFEIDGRVKNCKNLKSGVQAIVNNQNTVRQNIARFITPMHTVYLTNRTKFNHHGIGKMGLYINVNKKNEVRKRLVEFQVGVNDIKHEKMSKRL